MSSTSTTSNDKTIILTEENLPLYLEEKWKAGLLNGALPTSSSIADSDAQHHQRTVITAHQIKGGNLNFSFRVDVKTSNNITNDTTKEEPVVSLFVKQAPDYIAVFGPGAYPLTSTRSNTEVETHRAWSQINNNNDKKHYFPQSWPLPNLYYFDNDNKVIVMEFLRGQLLDKILISNNHQCYDYPKIATSLGQFMGLTHAATHSSLLSSKDRVEEYVEKFANLELRQVQNEYVFTKCYNVEEEGNKAQRQAAGLEMSEAFLQQVQILKEAYNNRNPNNPNLALLHGDLHPGSVMVTTSSSGSSSSSTLDSKIKIFDQEFSIYGPPSLDVGSLLSGYILAAVTLAFATNNTSSTDTNTQNHQERVQEIRDSVALLWDTYQSTMRNEGISSTEILQEIESQAVGYAVAEVCRTALEFAGDRVWLKFDGNEEIQRKAKRAAMRIVGKCMTDEERGMSLLLAELDTLVALAAARGSDE